MTVIVDIRNKTRNRIVRYITAGTPASVCLCLIIHRKKAYNDILILIREKKNETVNFLHIDIVGRYTNDG